MPLLMLALAKCTHLHLAVCTADNVLTYCACSADFCVTPSQRGWHGMQILARAPKLEAFRMASSRVGLDGGIALANSMTAGIA